MWDDEEFYRMDEISRRLKTSPSLPYKWARSKGLPVYRLGKSLRVKGIDLREFLEQRRVVRK